MKRQKRPAVSESDIQHDVRESLGKINDVVFWRNSCGVAGGPCEKCGHESRYIRYGLAPGSADLVGILFPSGRLLAIELKTAKGRAAEEQLNWLALVRKRGGFACIVRSVDDALAAIQRARQGLSE